tara:strand:- start:284 stop:949 length:666 start_codon:yes stop_codon:yes gene_type:complete
LSDPFSEIDKEVYLDKIKNQLKKYKFYIVVAVFLILVIPSFFMYSQHLNKEKNLKVSGYFIEILSLLQDDEAKAIKELDKLYKLDHEGFNFLSLLIKTKVNLKNKDFAESKKLLEEMNLNHKYKNNDLLSKIITFYSAQASLELNDQTSLNENVGKLLSFGNNWALLGHEIRGHYFLRKKDYKNAEKDFNKIINEQQSSNSIRSRAVEMLQNIRMYNEEYN